MIQKCGLWRALFFSHLHGTTAHQASAPLIRGSHTLDERAAIHADTRAAIALLSRRRELARILAYKPPTKRANQARARISMNGLRVRHLARKQAY